MKANSYVLILRILFRRNFDGVLLGCLLAEKTNEILKEMHKGTCGGHFTLRVNAHCILRAGCYWPTIFKDSYVVIRKCPARQIFSRRMKRATILVDAPFMEWGLDVIGSINPKSSQGHSYILTTTYYFTKWKEAKHFPDE
jgi:hypothetical protein